MKNNFAAVGVIAFGLIQIPAAAQTITDSSYSISTAASGFSLPTGIKFLGNDPTDLFVIEKNTGRVKRYMNGVTTTVLDLNVEGDSERGLLGIELDPGFASNGFVYLYHSTTTGVADTAGGVPDPWVDNRVTRYTWNGTTLTSPSLVRTFGAAVDGQANGANHDAGPLRFGPDGKLYGTTGDLNRNRAEQNNQSLPASSAIVGGIYRINADGSVPADNPFTSHATTELHKWYAYGVRNTFGIAFDPLTGNLWDTENGPGTMDEVNLVAEGFNSGWNKIMGPDSLDPQNAATDLFVLPNSSYSDPEYTWVDTNAPTGINFLANSTLDGGYRDAVLVGDNNRGQLYMFRLNETRTAFTLADIVANTNAEADLQRFGQSFGAITEIITGPDGGIYVTRIGSGVISRIGAPSWKANSDGAWSSAANWIGGLPSGTGARANFFGTITAARTVTVDSTRTVGSLTFNSPHRYTIAGSSPFALDVATGAALINVISGSHTIGTLQFALDNLTTIHVGPAPSTLTISADLLATNSAITKTGAGAVEVKNLRALSLNASGGTVKVLTNGGSAGVSRLKTLALTGGATLDLRDNDLVVDYDGASPYPTLRGYVLDGLDGAGGIVTTPAAPDNDVALALGEATDLPVTDWFGQSIDETTVIGRYTFYGDANMDGAVTSDDYVAVDVGIGIGTRWTEGDFDYSGDVTSDDYVAIDVNLGKGTPDPAAFAQLKAEMIALHAAMFGQAYLEKLAYAEASGFGATVPEPGSVALLGAASLLLGRRQR